MLDTSRVAGHDSAKRKQHFLQRIRYCKYIDREYKVAEIIFGNLNSKTGYQIAWPSEQSLSKTTGQNIRTIRQHVACLKALGVFTVDRMGGSEFRAWAEKEFGLSSEDTRASTKSRHLMNVYRPRWNSHLATTGQPSEEEVGKFLGLKAIRRQGSKTKAQEGDIEAARIRAPVPVLERAETARIRALVPVSNTGTGGTVNTGTGAPQSGGGERDLQPLFIRDVEDSDLEKVPPSAATDQNRQQLHQGGGIGQQGPISPQPCKVLLQLWEDDDLFSSPIPAKAAPRLVGVNPEKVSPALPAKNPVGFNRFLHRWDHLAQSLPSWKPMTAHALAKWVAAWDSIEALRVGIDQVLDAAAANPHLCGLKQGRVRFEMEPIYMLGFKHGSPIFALLATGSSPYFDFKRPIRERVAVLLNRHLHDAHAILATSNDFYDHERVRAAELLAELSRERAEAAARKAERDARASLLAENMADVAYRLAALEAQPLASGLDDLPEYIDGLESCPSAEGRELIANSLYKQTRYYNQWYRFEGFAAAFMSALADVDGPGAEKLRDALINRFGDEVGTERDEELAMLLGWDC